MTPTKKSLIFITINYAIKSISYFIVFGSELSRGHRNWLFIIPPVKQSINNYIKGREHKDQVILLFLCLPVQMQRRFDVKSRVLCLNQRRCCFYFLPFRRNINPIRWRKFVLIVQKNRNRDLDFIALGVISCLLSLTPSPPTVIELDMVVSRFLC